MKIIPLTEEQIAQFRETFDVTTDPNITRNIFYVFRSPTAPVGRPILVMHPHPARFYLNWFERFVARIRAFWEDR